MMPVAKIPNAHHHCDNQPQTDCITRILRDAAVSSSVMNLVPCL
jgi:hypothetical protein